MIKYMRHVVELGREHKVRIQWAVFPRYMVTVPTGYWANWIQCNVRIPIPYTDEGYAICLHEMGHIAVNGQRGFFFSSPLDVYTNEVEAWKWAYDHALQWTVDMEAMARLCLASYADTMKQAVLRDQLRHCTVDWRIVPSRFVSEGL